ncbi:hypothetical protein Ccrd_025000 [Cynara cardunculus var. scolymus]|uniref:Uncharacterized protein n=1 Tax=Cynara cardunculus var. scolymus TaxID=59895 RepID=A0A118JRK7_CYNCS|nr:hypothetical protein Ccrd_025000 [Cynara cardunculus var. scolymus]
MNMLGFWKASSGGLLQMESMVLKLCILNFELRWRRAIMDRPTIGADFVTKELQIDDEIVTVQVLVLTILGFCFWGYNHKSSNNNIEDVKGKPKPPELREINSHEDERRTITLNPKEMKVEGLENCYQGSRRRSKALLSFV